MKISGFTVLELTGCDLLYIERHGDSGRLYNNVYRCTCTMSSCQQIELLELDVWRNDPMQLCSQEEDRLYPPRFTIEVSGEAAVQSSEVLVSFTGIEERFAGKMRTKVSLPYIQQQGHCNRDIHRDAQ